MYVIYKLQSYVFWRVKQNKSPCFCLKAAGIAPFLPRGCTRACKPLIFNALQKVIFCIVKDNLLASERWPFATPKAVFCVNVTKTCLSAGCFHAKTALAWRCRGSARIGKKHQYADPC